MANQSILNAFTRMWYHVTTALSGLQSQMNTTLDSVQSQIDSKMNSTNPTGTGSFSLNRTSDSTVGDNSFAAGEYVIASGDCSHAEGNYTTASGVGSHAEGNYTEASGQGSHAEGGVTTASGDWQHVQGIANIADSTSAHIVGNGTVDYTGTPTPSNAHTLDWEGNAWFAGDVYVGSTSGTNKDEGSKKLATEEFVLANKNTWYGTCPTAASTTAKVVTTSTGDFSLTTGNIVYVLFTNYACASATLNVDGTGAIPIRTVGSTSVVQYQWGLNETVAFVFDGSNGYFRMLDGQTATTTYYGMTKLSSSISSTSTTTAATPYAVKQAYDLANGALPKAGGTMTGTLTLNSDPNNPMEAATKQYVDDLIGAILNGAS